MRFRLRKSFRFGPFYVNVTQRGISSWGIRLGRFRHNVTRGTTTVDTPGPGSVHLGGRPRS